MLNKYWHIPPQHQQCRKKLFGSVVSFVKYDQIILFVNYAIGKCASVFDPGKLFSTQLYPQTLAYVCQ
jgi:hypothetical protein